MTDKIVEGLINTLVSNHFEPNPVKHIVDWQADDFMRRTVHAFRVANPELTIAEVRDMVDNPNPAIR